MINKELDQDPPAGSQKGSKLVSRGWGAWPASCIPTQVSQGSVNTATSGTLRSLISSPVSMQSQPPTICLA